MSVFFSFSLSLSLSLKELLHGFDGDFFSFELTSENERKSFSKISGKTKLESDETIEGRSREESMKKKSIGNSAPIRYDLA